MKVMNRNNERLAKKVCEDCEHFWGYNFDNGVKVGIHCAENYIPETCPYVIKFISGDSEADIKKAIEGLMADGKLIEEIDMNKGHVDYELTKDGFEEALMLIKQSPDMAIFSFATAYNMAITDEDTNKDKIKKILQIASEFRDKFRVNILRILQDNPDKYEGGFGFSSDLPEDILQIYDPKETE